jgi:hypothetical protein
MRNVMRFAFAMCLVAAAVVAARQPSCRRP